ncbi:putative S-layer protein [archaeon]|nr:putative S-layer protein [archaeon]
MKSSILNISIILFALALLSGIASAGDLTLSISPSAGAGNPAESATYILTVGNTGASNISSIIFSASALTYSSYSISAPSLTAITNLTASSTQTQTFSIPIPSTMAGTYSGTITATDSGNAANTATITYTLEVYSKNDFSLSSSSIGISSAPDETETSTITITNTGSTSLTSWNITYSGDTEDNDGDEISYAFSGISSSDAIAPGGSKTLTITIEIDNDVDAGSYDGTITIASGTLTSETISTAITVEPQICEEGEQGDELFIDIQEPDAGDNLDIGDTLTIEAEVENEGDDDIEVILEAILYNIDEDDIVATEKSDATEVNEGDDKLFELTFEIPGDLDEDDEYYLYVKAYEEDNEEDSCAYERVSVDMGRQRHAVSLTGSVYPSQATCGDKFTITADAENVGSGDEDAVWFKIANNYLDINEESETFDLEDYDSDNNEKRETFSFTVPEGTTAKDYYINVYVYYDNGDAVKDMSVKLTVTECIAPEPETKLTLASTAFTGEVESQIAIPAVVENTGQEALTYTISVENITWGEITGIEQAGTVQAGSSSHAYLYIKPSATGNYMLTITLTDQNGDTDSEVISLTITEKEEMGMGSAISGWASGITENKQKIFWFGLDLLLVIIVIILIVSLFRKKKD